MRQRGRKSASASEVATERWENRPAPPDELSEAGAELWKAIVASKSPDYFDAGTFPMLREYCVLDGDVRALNEKLKEFDLEWLETKSGLETYDKLTAMRDKMQNRMIRIATSLRITNQARYHPTTAGSRQKATGAKPPWED